MPTPLRPYSVPPDDPRANILGIFLTKNGKLPRFAQRRLDMLLDKGAIGGKLTRDERRELDEMLRYIDHKSIELLKYKLALRPGPRRTRGSAKRGSTNSDRPCDRLQAANESPCRYSDPTTPGGN